MLLDSPLCLDSPLSCLSLRLCDTNAVWRTHPRGTHTRSYATLLLEKSAAHASSLAADKPHSLDDQALPSNHTLQHQSWMVYKQRADWHLAQAMALEPHHTDALFNHAVVRQTLHGDAAHAALSLSRVLQLKPDDADAEYNYGVALEERAEVFLQKALHLLHRQPTSGGPTSGGPTSHSHQIDHSHKGGTSQKGGTSEMKRVRRAVKLLESAQADLDRAKAPPRLVQLHSPHVTIDSGDRGADEVDETGETDETHEILLCDLIAQMHQLLPAEAGEVLHSPLVHPQVAQSPFVPHESTHSGRALERQQTGGRYSGSSASSSCSSGSGNRWSTVSQAEEIR